MTTTNVDIVNRALQLVGTRTTVASLAENSNEAIQANLVYQTVFNWCHSALNWNFARKVAVLTQTKVVVPTPPWTTTLPAPPWKYECTLPADWLVARYVFNNSIDSSSSYFLGEPKRFVIAFDSTTEVLLTNESPANLVYTGYVTDPTLWPSYFERFTVAALAKELCLALTGDKQLFVLLAEMMVEYFTTAQAINQSEGLILDDKTPEWITAVGIPYPYRRYRELPTFKQPEQKSDNRR